MTFGFHREQWSELPPLTIHPCRNPLLPPGIYTNGTPSYIYPHPCATLCALRRHAEWNELSNQLGFKPIASRDGSYAVATHTRAWRKSVRATCTYYICVYIYICSLARSVRHLPFPAFFSPSSSLIFLPDRLKAPTLRPFYVFLSLFAPAPLENGLVTVSQDVW